MVVVLVAVKVVWGESLGKVSWIVPGELRIPFSRRETGTRGLTKRGFCKIVIPHALSPKQPRNCTRERRRRTREEVEMVLVAVVEVFVVKTVGIRV